VRLLGIWDLTMVKIARDVLTTTQMNFLMKTTGELVAGSCTMGANQSPHPTTLARVQVQFVFRGA